MGRILSAFLPSLRLSGLKENGAMELGSRRGGTDFSGPFGGDVINFE